MARARKAGKRTRRPPFDLAPPRAASLVESLRAFGYELPSAIADLVDNSISAKANNIWVDFYWKGDLSVIAVTDDGDGMTESALVAAMRPGSQSPLKERSPLDLGRFGLGLKTASFSQCRKVTVRSRVRRAGPSTRCWDLDHVSRVDEWQLLRAGDEASERQFERLASLPSGTTVVWQKLDRVAAGFSVESESDHQNFLRHADDVGSYLGMVFHRFIARARGIQIHLNDRPIQPWDPFLENHAATQALPLTKLRTKGGSIEIRPFVLPHHSKLSKTEFVMAAGLRGWNAHQGFYVYRNQRLLVPGDWLGLGWVKEEHYKLARLRVDIPTSMDLAWEIDVTKSRARPPVGLRSELRHIGERTRADAKRVYSFRGARMTPQADSDRVLLWVPTAKHDKMFYRLNPEHPLLKQALASAGNTPALRALLRLIEETVPVPQITIANSEEPHALPQPFEKAKDSEIAKVMEETFRSLISDGYGKREALRRLQLIFPFDLFPALLESFKESHLDA
ncbi:MAG: ATP-binding protein [Thermoanaerobaculia bacterium]